MLRCLESANRQINEAISVHEALISAQITTTRVVCLAIVFIVSHSAAGEPAGTVADHS